jgi:primosomal replication protein N
LSGRLLERGALRHTPAGVAVVEFRLGHVSQQIEAGTPRRVECEMRCVVLGPMANLLADSKPGDGLKIGGFLAARSLKNPAPVLHVNTLEFFEGNQNGFQTEG